MEETVETALGAAFPGRVIDRTFGVGPSWNGANETVGVVFADGSRVFCKVAVAGDGSRIAREIAVLRYLDAGRPISGPEVLAGDPDASVPYLVTAPAPGRELLGVWEEAEEAQREALLRRVGATLATLHAERFETHGEIVGGSDEGEIGSRSGSALILDPAPWPDVLRATIERTREIGTSERLADHYDAVFDCVEANRDRLGGAPAALLHGDVAKPNLFVTDDGGVGVDAESRTDTGPDGSPQLTGSSRTSAIRPATSFARRTSSSTGSTAVDRSDTRRPFIKDIASAPAGSRRDSPSDGRCTRSSGCSGVRGSSTSGRRTSTSRSTGSSTARTPNCGRGWTRSKRL